MCILAMTDNHLLPIPPQPRVTPQATAAAGCLAVQLRGTTNNNLLAAAQILLAAPRIAQT